MYHPLRIFSDSRKYPIQHLIFYTIIFLISSSSLTILLFSYDQDIFRSLFFVVCILASLTACSKIFKYYRNTLSPPLILYIYTIIVWLIAPFVLNSSYISELSASSPTEIFPDDKFLFYSINFLIFTLSIFPILRITFFRNVSDLLIKAQCNSLEFYSLPSRVNMSLWTFLISSTILLVSLVVPFEVVTKLCVLPFAFFSIYLIQRKAMPISGSTVIVFLLAALSILPAYKIRYVFSLYLFCLLYFIVLFSTNISLRKYFVIVPFTILTISIYSVVSYIYKLNSNWGGSYDLLSTLGNNDLILKFLFAQIFRIILIWPINSGNIVDLLGDNFQNGTSYIDFLLSFLGITYESLPERLTVTSPGTTYVQPGLFGEAYANFGFLAPSITLILLYLLITFLFHIFLSDLRIPFLLLSSVPFFGIIIDGGSLTSPIFYFIIWILLFPNYFISAFKSTFWLKLSGLRAHRH